MSQEQFAELIEQQKCTNNLLRELLQSGREVNQVGRNWGIRPADMNVYCGDDYSREGCSVTVRLTKTGWSFAAFAPGFDPGGTHGFIESYCGKHGSLGMVIDAYAAGTDVRSIRKQVLQAEMDYAASSGSAVTL